jgi:hypothetical protein
MAVASAFATGHAPTLNAVYPALRPWDPVPHSTSAPIYSKYAIGQSLLALPLYVVGLLHQGNGLVYINNHPFAPQGPFLSMMALGTAACTFVNPLDLYGRAGYPPQVTWSMPHSFLANVPWLYHHAGFDSWVLQQAPPLLRLLPNNRQSRRCLHCPGSRGGAPHGRATVTPTRHRGCM